MAYNSSIEWTGSSWNPITGCSRLSEGCKNCYAERMAARLKAMGQKNYSNGFDLTIHEDMFALPLKWIKPQRIFVNSMSDLFHEEVPLPVIQALFKVMKAAHWHTFQILTKRSNILREYDKFLEWSDNTWTGVTIESRAHMDRLDDLRQTKARLKFISFEPLLSRIEDVDLQSIDWVIAGGESGPGARAIKEEWVIEIRDQCITQKVPFFFKQWGGVRRIAGRR
ncbi:MAG: phage Gp37/Gp68 family protein [Spirochaetes bacterium]|nr:MAG: phage Gp37/Gp68 family protein [Spirochaetota bacterium]